MVEDTHEPIISREVFDKVQMLIESRKHTRSRTHDYLLKGLLYCHECGYPLGVINRKLSGGGEALYTVCRTYQRFTKLRQCTCHCVRAETVTNAVVAKIRDTCAQYLNREDCAEILSQAEKEAAAIQHDERGIQAATLQLDSLTAQLDKVYDDKLCGALDDTDFQRIYQKIKQERQRLQAKLDVVKTDKVLSAADINAVIEHFLSTANTNRELLCSLIERIELTESKEILIYFRFSEL